MNILKDGGGGNLKITRFAFELWNYLQTPPVASVNQATLGGGDFRPTQEGKSITVPVAKPMY